jgi:pyridoxal phosphate enzyme (YggS family)
VIDDPVLSAAIGARWVAVRRRIEDAAAAADRDPADVRVVAVTKGFGPEVVRAALAAGLTRFGENRVQEGEAKVADAPDAEWHLIGHLQSNKVRRAVTAFAWLEGVDSAEVLTRVDRAAGEEGRRTQVLLQVNVAEAATQHGFAAATIADSYARAALVAVLDSLTSVDVLGLMAIGPLTSDAAVSRAAFGAVRRLGDQLQEATGRPFPELSMGMSADLEAAVAEGATLVRVGTALFGDRPEAE